MQTCYQLGMRPIAFEKPSEQMCLANLKLEKWPLNFNYWTSGSQEQNFGYFNWVANDGYKELHRDLTWASKTPDYRTKNGTRNCLKMKFYKSATGNISIQLSDRMCSEKFVLGCEVFLSKLYNTYLSSHASLFIANILKSETPPPTIAPCLSASCPSLQQCVKKVQ